MRICFVSWILFSLAAHLIPAQENRGTISGLITDQGAATVAGALIRVTNVDTGVAQTSKSGSSGDFSVPFLPPGTYRVEVEAQGFATAINPAALLNAGQTLRVNFALQIGNVKQTISVSAEAPMLQAASTNTGQTLGTTAVQELPLLNRNLFSIALLGTGMQTSQNVISNVIGSLLTGGVTVTANGLRDSANQYTIDGANVNVGMYNYPTFVPIPDAVQEFTVQTGNYSADYGQFAGAHVNYVLKSGTNAFHGSAFDYLQNNDLNARNFFSPTIPVLRQNQFGGVLGGPIKRNKTFFLVSYQGLRNFTDSYVQSVVATAAQRIGDLSLNTDGSPAASFTDPTTGAPFQNNQIPVSRLSAQAKAALQFDPLPSQPGSVNYATFVDQPETSDDGLVKIDHSFNERDQLSGRFLSTTLSSRLSPVSLARLLISLHPLKAKILL